MTLYPEIQRKAQDEVDRVVGDRLPGAADLPNLPYFHAIISEILRWNPIASLVAHTARDDGFYREYFIPKGSMILLNVWGLLHDPQVYDDPMTFNPDRFIAKPGQLEAPETDPRKFAFGMGRRSCPGRHLAEATISIACVMSLAAFDISKAVDENGMTIMIDPAAAYTDSTASRPEPFKCSIKPRSAKTKEVILSLVVDT